MPAAPEAPAGSSAPVGDDEVRPQLDRAFAGAGCVLIAVSGGADSMALMHLAARWRTSRAAAGPSLHVATVDHGLREAAAAEAQWVAECCACLGLPHSILVWQDPKPATGIQDSARAARYHLLARLAQTLSPAPRVIAVAHTLDDQAETLLMRLARGSGVDGLAAMAARRKDDRIEGGIDIVRPLLAVPKARLVATLQAAGLDWLEDPSNAAERFERVRLRRHAPALAAIGLSNASLALSASRLMRARRALEAATRDLERSAVDYHAGAFARIAGATLVQAPEEIALRLVSRIIERLGGEARPPPMAQMETLLARLAAAAGEGRRFAQSVAGCLVSRGDDEAIDVFRESGRTGLPVLTLEPGAAAIWDNRFHVRFSATAGSGDAGPLTVRALPAAVLADLKRAGGAAVGLPRRAALTLPSAWRGEELVAAPHLGIGSRTTAGGEAAVLFEAKFLQGRAWIDGAT